MDSKQLFRDNTQQLSKLVCVSSPSSWTYIFVSATRSESSKQGELQHSVSCSERKRQMAVNFLNVQKDLPLLDWSKFGCRRPRPEDPNVSLTSYACSLRLGPRFRWADIHQHCSAAQPLIAMFLMRSICTKQKGCTVHSRTSCR